MFCGAGRIKQNPRAPARGGPENQNTCALGLSRRWAVAQMTVRRGSMRNIINIGIAFHGLQRTFSFLLNPHTHPKAHIAIPTVHVRHQGPRSQTSKQYAPAWSSAPTQRPGRPFPLPALLGRPSGGQWEGTAGAGTYGVRPTCF